MNRPKKRVSTEKGKLTRSGTSNFLGCFKLERPLLVSFPYFKNLLVQ